MNDVVNMLICTIYLIIAIKENIPFNCHIVVMCFFTYTDLEYGSAFLECHKYLQYILFITTNRVASFIYCEKLLLFMFVYL